MLCEGPPSGGPSRRRVLPDDEDSRPGPDPRGRLRRARGRKAGRCACLSVKRGESPDVDRVGDAAHHRRRTERPRDAGRPPALGEGRRLLAPGRRAVVGLARRTGRLGQPARGRPHDARWVVRHRAHDVRRRPEPGRPLPLSANRLRRLVGRGSAVAVLQPVPSPPLRGAPAVPRHDRRHVDLADRLPASRLHPLQHRSGRAGTRVGDLPTREHRQADTRVHQPPGAATRQDAALAPTGRARRES